MKRSDHWVWLLLLTGVFLLHSCSKKNAGDSSSPQPVTLADAQITSFTPTSGAKGTSVVITGTGFSGNVVMFNGMTATVTATTATSITVNVPPGAGSGKISIVAGGKRISSATDFQYVYTVSTLAGDGNFGFNEGPGAGAEFMSPLGLAIDGAGTLYISDTYNQRIRKITTPDQVGTIAGNDTIGYTNSTGIRAKFHDPHGLTLDVLGNIYVADYRNHVIRKVTPGGVVSTVAGSGIPGLANGTGTAAQFNSPQDVAIDANGNLFVTDAGNNCIRKITPAGVVSTFAAALTAPKGITIDAAANLYITDGQVIRKITAAGVMSTLAGSTLFGLKDGIGADARFFDPQGIAIDASGNLFVADRWNNAIRRVTAAGVVSTIAGNILPDAPDFKEGPGPDARFDWPHSIAVDAAGTIYVGDIFNSRIRKVQ
ncbi:IPT/TIG domain-containing protein [Mucilaginibacter sp. AW1-3]